MQDLTEFENINDSKFESFYLSNPNTEFSSIDYDCMYNTIIERYPKFDIQKYSVVIVKKTFVGMLQDESFMKELLKEFDLTIKDFFKVIYKHNSVIFNTYFINKIKDTIKNVRYT